MDIEIQDRGLQNALTQILGREGPFTTDECATLTGPLKITHAQDLTELRFFRELGHLEIMASDITEAPFLKELKKLSVLKIYCTPLKEISSIVHCGGITNLELCFTLLDDLEPLMSLLNLRVGRFLGNPWSKENYRTTRLKLLKKSGMIAEFSAYHDWASTKKIVDAGFPLCSSAIDGVREILVRPGIPVFTKAVADFTLREENDASASMFVFTMQYREDCTNDEFLKQFFSYHLSDAERDNSKRHFDFKSHRTLGAATHAKTWIKESNLTGAMKESLLGFVNRFPDLVFYKEDKSILDFNEKRYGIRFSNLYRRIRQTLAGVYSDDLSNVFVQYGEPISERQGAGDCWFSLASFDTSVSIRESLEEQVVPYGIARAAGGNYHLAIDLADEDDVDCFVYMYAHEDIDCQNYGPPFLTKNRVFLKNYSEILGGVESIKIIENDEEIVFTSKQ